jgi:hypothetical protein
MNYAVKACSEYITFIYIHKCIFIYKTSSYVICTCLCMQLCSMSVFLVHFSYFRLPCATFLLCGKVYYPTMREYIIYVFVYVCTCACVCVYACACVCTCVCFLDWNYFLGHLWQITSFFLHTLIRMCTLIGIGIF